MNRALKVIIVLLVSQILVETVRTGVYAQNAVTYKIQVASSKVKISAERMSRELRLSDPVAIHYIDRWYKYFVGNFSNEAEAADYLKKIPVKDAFIARISGNPENLGQRQILPTPEKTIQNSITADSLARAKADSTTAADLKRNSELLYIGALRKADSAFFISANYQEARSLYQRALVIDPLKNYPRDQIIEIDRLLRNQGRKSFFTDMPPLLKYAIIFFILVMILVLIITLILRTRRQGTDKKNRLLREEYQESLTEVLFEPGKPRSGMFDKADSPQKKQILIDEIMQLYANLSGEIANKLRELYIELGLDNESIAKTKSNQWHIRAKGFRELAQMNIPAVREEIERCLNSNNENLRMEAQLALIRLNYEDPFSFLSRLKQPFTDWEQLQVHEMIKSYQVDIPDFTRWLNSSNETVAVFCVRMIRVFNQEPAFPKLVELLSHPNPDIRQEVIGALGDLKNPEVLPVLRDRYYIENHANRVRIIKAISKLPDDSNIEFLRSILEPDNELRIEAAEALSGIESFGVKGIETILKRSDEDLQSVARHILDNKLNR